MTSARGLTPAARDRPCQAQVRPQLSGGRGGEVEVRDEKGRDGILLLLPGQPGTEAATPGHVWMELD